MKSPKERYEQDVNYRQMVDAMTAMIEQCHFTPAEMREMAIMASIHYEMRHAIREYTVPLNVADSLKNLERWRAKPDQEA